MTDQRFLVTGALGCLGAWTVQRLIDEGTPVWTYDLPGEPRRLRLLLSDEQLSHVHFIDGDITDQDGFERAVGEHGITHIVHLAALQVPFVRADPVAGARVNVVGTAVVLETAKRFAGQLQGLAYASSVGVYGPDDHDGTAATPPTLYGVYKQANEGMARIYWQEHAVASVGLRPFVVYGPGRDQGMTSTPTKAMLAAALGRAYSISFGGSAVYQYAADTADAFLRAARADIDGAPVYNLGGTMAEMAQIVAAIEAAVPEMRGMISYATTPLPNPPSVDDRAFEQALGTLRWTPLVDGVRQTVDRFRAAIATGRLDAERALA